MDESWKEVNVPNQLNEIIKFLTSIKISDLRRKYFDDICDQFDGINTATGDTGLILLSINSKTFKVQKCIYEWAIFMFDAIKMISLFDISKLDMIIQQLLKNTKNFCQHLNNLILGEELFSVSGVEPTLQHICQS